MIQDQQKLTQDLLSLIPNVVREMPPISASETDCLVSTTLCLYDPTWPKSSDDTKISCGPRGNTGTEEKENSLMKLKLLSNEGRQEEEQYGVSTELTLFTDPWTIKKKLTISDRSRQNCLLLNPRTVHSHIMRYLPEVSQKMVQEGSGLTVDVYDHNTHTTHQMLLMKLIRRGSYVLSGRWRMDFVMRRALKTKDEIGMYWDLSDSKLHFCVLSRAPTRVSSGSVLAVPSQAPIEVSSGYVLAGQSQAPIEISSGSVLESPSQAPIEVSSGSVLAGQSQAPIEISSDSVLESPSQAPIEVSSGSVLAGQSQAPIEISSGSVLASPSQAPIEVSSGSVLAGPSQAPIEVSSGSVLAGPSQAPIGVSSGSVTIASYSALLADP